MNREDSSAYVYSLQSAQITTIRRLCNNYDKPVCKLEWTFVLCFRLNSCLLETDENTPQSWSNARFALYNERNHVICLLLKLPRLNLSTQWGDNHNTKALTLWDHSEMSTLLSLSKAGFRLCDLSVFFFLDYFLSLCIEWLRNDWRNSIIDDVIMSVLRVRLDFFYPVIDPWLRIIRHDTTVLGTSCPWLLLHPLPQQRSHTHISFSTFFTLVTLLSAVIIVTCTKYLSVIICSQQLSPQIFYTLFVCKKSQSNWPYSRSTNGTLLTDSYVTFIVL